MKISNLVNTKYKKILLSFIVSVLFAFLFETVVFNSNSFFHPTMNKEINLSEVETKGFQLVDNTLVNDKNKAKIIMDLNNEFVGKIKIEYDAVDDFVTKIYTKEKNTFGKEVESVYRDQEVINTSSRLHLLVENINATVDTSEIKMTLSANESIVIKSITLINSFSINFARLITMFILFFGILIFFFFKKFFFEKIERSFLVIVLVIGSSIILLTPSITYLSMDDIVHYKNSATLIPFSNNISKTENELTSFQVFHKDMINSKEELNDLNIYLNENHVEKNLGGFGKGFIPYSRFGYIPSAITLKAASILNVPFTISFALGRLTNLLFYSLIMFFAIKIAPIKKRIFVLFALIPTNIFMACNYSLDPIITSCLTLGFSLFLRELFSKEKIDFKYTLLYLATTIFGILPKPIYAPLVLMPLLLSKDKFDNKKQMKYFKIGLVLIFIVLISTFVLPTLLSPSVQGDVRAAGQTSQIGQITSILSNIPGYIQVFINNAGDQFFMKFFGPDALTSVGYLNQIPENIYYFFLIAIITFSVLRDSDEKKKLTFNNKIFIFALLFVIIGLIWTALYVDFTEVATLRIRGVQARYFLPILLPLLCCLDIGELKVKFSKLQINCILFTCIYICLFFMVYFCVLSVFQF